MRRKVIITAIGLLLVMINGVNAQISRVAYFMNIPQSHFLNPAIKPATRFYIGIPGLSGINVRLDNNFLKLSDFLIPGIKGDSAYTFNHSDFDLKKVASKLNKSNAISADASVQLLGLGFQVGKNYSIFIDITDRFTSKILFPKELLSLYIAGPADFIGKTVDISNANFKGQYFREYAVGFSGEIINNLRIGARLKLLSGITSLSFDDRSFSLTVNNDLSQTVSSDASMDMAGKDALNTIFLQNGILGKADSTTKTNVKGFLGSYFGNPIKNPGFGVDLGAVYNLGTLLTFSVAVTDLGFINWKDGLKSWKSTGTFTLPGLTLQDVQKNGVAIDDIFRPLKDSIKSNFKSVPSPQPFKTYLPTTISAGISVNPVKFLSVGVLSELQMYAGSIKESVSLSGNLHFGSLFSTSLAYTIANYSYNNLGFGLAFKAGFAQIYIIADKIPVSWEKYYIKKPGSSDYMNLPLPGSLNVLNLQLGLNIAFGKPASKKTDTPMLQSKDQPNQ